MTKEATSIRLSPEGKRKLAEVAAHLGVSQTAILEVAIRQRWGEVMRQQPPIRRGEGACEARGLTEKRES